MRFRTRPVEFEAFRWVGQSSDTWPPWFRERFSPSDLTISRDKALMGIQVGREFIVVERGGWICISQDGHIYPVTEQFLNSVADPVDGEAGDGKEKG